MKMKGLSFVGSATIHDINDIEETIKLASYNKYSMMLQPVSWTCCCLFEHVAAGHIAACLIIL
jgi:hypothetical protein